VDEKALHEFLYDFYIHFGEEFFYQQIPIAVLVGQNLFHRLNFGGMHGFPVEFTGKLDYPG
jgi:hypothetical protein